MGATTGKIGRIDITADNAAGARDFYKAVVGTAKDVDTSVAACEATGGQVVVPVRGLAGGRFCAIRDPSGAAAAPYQS